MKNEVLINASRFIVLLLLQVLLLNNIQLFGYLTPYLYVLFILLYPINSDRALFLILAFLMGLSVDIFGNSGGIHAAACLCMAYARPLLLKASFGVSYEYNAIKIKDMPLGSRFTYVIGLVIVHHLVLFSLEIFSVNHILLILKSTLFTVVFTTILLMFILLLTSSKSR